MNKEIAQPLVAAITFVICWIYAIAAYGWFLGLGLGWLPSIFIALIAGFLWRLILLALLIGAAVAVIAWINLPH